MCSNFTESHMSTVYKDLPSLSPNRPTWLTVHLILLLHCPRICLALLTQTIDSHIVQCFTLSCQTDLISCQANFISVFDRVAKLDGFREYCRHSISGFCKGDDNILWSFCGQDGQKKVEDRVNKSCNWLNNLSQSPLIRSRKRSCLWEVDAEKVTRE